LPESQYRTIDINAEKREKIIKELNEEYGYIIYEDEDIYRDTFTTEEIEEIKSNAKEEDLNLLNYLQSYMLSNDPERSLDPSKLPPYINFHDLRRIGLSNMRESSHETYKFYANNNAFRWSNISSVLWIFDQKQNHEDLKDLDYENLRKDLSSAKFSEIHELDKKIIIVNRIKELIYKYLSRTYDLEGCE
jgi:hypothetical protein